VTSSTFSISVVVPAYNEESSLGALLESLAAQDTSLPFEVIVVNNASTDRTKQVAQQYTSQLTLTVLDEPRKGRGPARATGFAHAQGEIIFSTDADAIVPSNWISSLSTKLSDTRFAAVSGTCRVQDLTWSQNMAINTVMPLAMRGFWLLYGTPWLTGSNFAIRRNVYELSGGFNSTLAAIEDAELALRVKPHGRIKMVTDTPVITSGRRFAQHGVFKGLVDYVTNFRNLRHQGPHSATLDDPR